MNKFLSSFIVILILSLKINNSLYAQQNILTPSEIENALEKLNVLGSVLYIAAHPDDENTSLMAYLSKGKKYRTGYLSLTRGDGGQNLIGSEKGVEIGILRTQELIQARRIDGGEQFFTRAVDFGYSKSPEETFEIWNKEEILEDVVWVIRKFQPDVIITRFPFGSSGGHGHHTASTIIAAEAFKAAADPNKFTEQLKYVQTWKAKRIFWNNWRPSVNDAKGLISVDVGEYNPLLGKSYTELGADSRTMHKSQGFGSSAFRGSRLEYFELIDGESAEKNIFDGIDYSWNRIKNGTNIGGKISEILNNFRHENPSKSIPSLVSLFDEINKLDNNNWINVKKQELLNIIKSCAGLWLEATAHDYSASPGDEINIKTTVVNRSDIPFSIERINFPTLGIDISSGNKLNNNEPSTIEEKILLPIEYQISQPYWLKEKSTAGLFEVTDLTMIGLAENPPAVPVKIILNYEGRKLEYTIPLVYKWNDRVEGEQTRPFEVRPPVVANIADNVSIFSNDEQKEIQIKLKANSNNIKGVVKFKSNDGWIISPSEIQFELKNKYDEKSISLNVNPPKNSGETILEISMQINGKQYDNSLVEISYPHIPSQVYFPKSEIKLVKLDIQKTVTNIGYVMGSGDKVAESLQNAGYTVTLLTDEMLEENNLQQYDAIITGVRAYNTRERLKFARQKLLNYMSNGGTLIVQYNVSSGLVTQDIGPYPFRISQGRITDEEAKINFVDPNNEILNFPNKISNKDFDDWVQERGLYFADEWDKNYKTIFSGSDKNEKELFGSTLFTRYGKGAFIYTGLSWFRQLPAGIPGAYKIFANMIEAGKHDQSE
jgi:LmbE family N-acetylglucosaminyl deacetylase